MRTCKAPVKLSPPTNQHSVSFYRLDALPVTQPSLSEHWRKKIKLTATQKKCRGCVKCSRPTLTWYDFHKGRSIFMIFFTVKFRKDLQRKMQLKSPPPLKSAVALPGEMFLQFKCSRGMLFLVYLHRLMYDMCLKCSPLAHMHVFSREQHWSTGASKRVVQCCFKHLYP